MTSTIAGCDHLQYICFWYYTLDAEESGFSVFIALSFSYEADRLLHVVLVLRLLVIAPFSSVSGEMNSCISDSVSLFIYF